MNKTLLSLNLDYNHKLGSNGANALSKGIALNSTLKTLSLRYCGIDDASMFSEVLIYPNTSIETLELEGNFLGGPGLTTLCTGLQSNETLRNLNLADNKFAPNDDSTHAFKSFGVILANHKSLISINLLRNLIEKESANMLQDGLELNRMITTFKIDSSMICPEIFARLCRLPSKYTKKKRKGSSKKKKKKK